MAKKVFISYSHKQKDWVHNRLAPVLEAGGAEILIDVRQFQIGAYLPGAMDALQDQADTTLLVLTPDHLASPACTHERNRAIARNAFLPVKREDCTLPAPIPDHLYADLRNDQNPDPWDKLLTAAGADLRCQAPHWLAVRDETHRYLDRGDSVNLVVSGHPQWRPLIAELERRLPTLKRINLEDGETAGRPGLVAEILRAHGDTRPVPSSDKEKDIALFSRFLKERQRTMLAFLRFDNVAYRKYQVDFFSNLNFHLNERRLITLIESSSPFASFLPQGHNLSSLTQIKHVELQGR